MAPTAALLCLVAQGVEWLDEERNPLDEVLERARGEDRPVLFLVADLA